MNVIRTAALLAGVLLGVLPGSAPAAQAKSSEPVPAIDRAVLQSRYGIRVDLIAVTAGGGLVDFRFTVLDPAKARPLLEDHARMPRLLPADGTVPLEVSHGAMHGVRIRKDATSFLLFPNARRAIHSGTPVSVLFGDVRVEPIEAK